MIDQTTIDLTTPPSLRSFRRLLAFILAVCCALTCVKDLPAEDIPLTYYLSEEMSYDEAIPTPAEFLGFQIGQRHIHHHELVAYMRKLAAASDRATIEEFSHTHSGKPQVMLTITCPDNHEKLETIRQQHLQFVDPRYGDVGDISQQPAVINMGYSVHGNEASGGNASALVAYHLVAGQGEEHEELLRRVVVLLDPCLNPDGFERFANWANNNRGKVASPDPLHREHLEPWPNGRTNYYWFDLNRDWLPAQHPESQGRLAMYHRWKPNVVLDFHEMGSNSTFFFHPGEPLRNNPLVPQRTIELTEAFAKRHAAKLDQAGSRYYTEEGFDDFYMGKGSTYPDLHGAVGILFEQASARGLKQDTINGELTFPFTIRNQVLASLSSLQATRELREELLAFQHNFYEESLALAKNAAVQGHLFSAPDDSARLYAFLQILGRHNIQAFWLAEDVEVDGQRFAKGHAVVVPARQEEYRFLTSLFEYRTEFAENIFYDVSAWSLPAAFNLTHAEVKPRLPESWLGQTANAHDLPAGEIPELAEETIAYFVDWQGYYAPRAVHRLLAAGVKIHVGKELFTAETSAGLHQFSYGTLMIPLAAHPGKHEWIHKQLTRAAKEEGLNIFAASSGLTTGGIDLGSANFAPVQQPKVILVTGDGANTYQAGEVWHLLDERMRMPVSLINGDDLASADLSQYTTIVLTAGDYSALSDSVISDIVLFASRGGTLITIGSAARFATENGLADVEFRSRATSIDPREGRRPFVQAADDAALDLVAGAIFRTHVDVSHPLGYGFPDSRLAVFRAGTVILEPSSSPYNTPVAYEEDTLVAGYVSSGNLEQLKGSAAVVAEPFGRGRVIVFADDPNFRAFWYGTNRLFLNAIFFGDQVSGGRRRGDADH